MNTPLTTNFIHTLTVASIMISLKNATFGGDEGSGASYA